jgi:hypothetical protein
LLSPFSLPFAYHALVATRSILGGVCGLILGISSIAYCRLLPTPPIIAHGSNTTPAQRKDHRAEAHHLNRDDWPDGLTVNVKKSTPP